jgi:hypothetical protein
MSDFTKYVGRRALVKETISACCETVEVRIKEVSPSGNHVLLKFAGSEMWVLVAKYELIEVLPEPATDDKYIDECRKVFMGVADDFIRFGKAFQKAMEESKGQPTEKKL